MKYPITICVAISLLTPIPAVAQLADGGKLLPSVPSPLTGSIAPVAIDGDLAVVGTEIGYGYVFIFEKTATGWTESAAIRDPSEMLGVAGYTTAFGTAVAINGTTVVVGNYNHSEGLKTNPPCCVDQNLGAIHVYELENNEWTQTAFFTLPEHLDGRRDKTFGSTVAIGGDTLFASTINGWGGDNQSWHGIIARFTRSGGEWSHVETFSGPNTQPRDDFGSQLAMHGGTLLATSDLEPDDTLPITNQLVHVYEETGSTWTYAGDLTPSNVADDSRYGVGLAIHEGVAAIGARDTKGQGNKTSAGAVHVFMRGALDGTWGETPTLTAGDPSAGAQFGFPLALDADTLIVGSRTDSSNVTRGGSAYHFERVGNTFLEIAKFVPGDNAAEDEFGGYLAIDAGNAFIVAPNDDDLGSDNGSIYLYDCGDDTDEDGLCDDWETLGVPYYDSNGDLQRYLLDIDGNGFTDANPMHKDLFLEIDSMPGRTYPTAAKALIEASFDLAPVDNPDLDIGIDLHILIDESTLDVGETVISETGWPLNVEELRAGHFGTVAERASPDAEARLAAKAKAFRYSINGNIGEILKPDFTTRRFGGIAELPGDESVLYGAGFSDEAMAAVLMHELGHNLRLKHGGGDHVNGKPNYPSIMNYALAYREDWNDHFWALDYCNEVLATLNEASLDETTPNFSAASGFYDAYDMPYHGIVPDGSLCFNPSEFNTAVTEYLLLDRQSQTDFNLDCDVEDSVVVGDLNNLPSSGLPGSDTASPNQSLHGFNDWENLRLQVSDGGGTYKGALPPDELTEDQRQYMRDHFPVPEPGSLAQLGAGIACLLGLRGWRNRRS